MARSGAAAAPPLPPEAGGMRAVAAQRGEAAYRKSRAVVALLSTTLTRDAERAAKARASSRIIFKVSEPIHVNQWEPPPRPRWEARSEALKSRAVPQMNVATIVRLVVRLVAVQVGLEGPPPAALPGRG